MARAKASTLAVKKRRLELPVARRPVFDSLGDGICLGYRRNRGAGTWVVRKADGRGGSAQRTIGYADDYQEPNGQAVLTWAQAQAKAFGIAANLRNSDLAGSPKRAITVRQAIDNYAVDLKTRGGDLGNVARLFSHVPPILQDRIVAELRRDDLRAWRDRLLSGLRPSSVNRTCNAFRAALNRAADQLDEITNRHVWEVDLAALPDASVARNVVLTEHTIRAIVAAAYRINEPLGLLLETAAITGSRYGQIAGLRIRDLQHGDGSPRLMMPSARKGKGVRKVQHRPVPIPLGFAGRLNRFADGRHEGDHLLVKVGGQPWKKSDQTRPFALSVKLADLEEATIAPHSPKDITIYSFRHSSIARQILRNVPIRLVAVIHDTSVAMIEKNYSALLADHSDAITRAALMTLGEEEQHEHSI